VGCLSLEEVALPMRLTVRLQAVAIALKHSLTGQVALDWEYYQARGEQGRGGSRGGGEQGGSRGEARGREGSKSQEEGQEKG